MCLKGRQWGRRREWKLLERLFSINSNIIEGERHDWMDVRALRVIERGGRSRIFQAKSEKKLQELAFFDFVFCLCLGNALGCFRDCSLLFMGRASRIFLDAVWLDSCGL